MLLIIADGLVKEYEKVKSEVSPKEFAKERVKCGKKSYDNSSKFYEDYFGKNIELLVYSIEQYQKLKSKGHKKDEMCLVSLLK